MWHIRGCCLFSSWACSPACLTRTSPFPVSFRIFPTLCSSRNEGSKHSSHKEGKNRPHLPCCLFINSSLDIV
ncbi:hypothetical protein Peur_022665 [Populus x canadensis]